MFLIPQVTQLSLSFSLSLVFVDSRMTRMMDMVRDYIEKVNGVCVYFMEMDFKVEFFRAIHFIVKKIEKMLEGKGRK